MRELYVYYRVPAPGTERTMAAVRALHDELHAQRPDLTARLLRRPEAEKGRETWMEIYASRAAGGVDAETQAFIESRAEVLLGGLIDGARHVEVFLACAS